MSKPIAWADDRVIAGSVGNCASAAAKEHWERSDWVDRESANRLRHPLFSQAQLAAAVLAEREACARLCEERHDLKIATTYDWTKQVGQDIALAIRSRSNVEFSGAPGFSGDSAGT